MDSLPLNDFLLKNKSIDGFYSHVSLLKPKGKYLFNHDIMDNFWSIYSNTVIKNNFELNIGIAEKPQTYLPVIVDVDLKVQTQKESISEEKLYTNFQLNILIKTFQCVLSQYVKDLSNTDLTCILLEKPFYTKKYGFNIYKKNGFHLHFPYIFLSKDDQKIFIFSQVKKYLLLKQKDLFKNIGIEDASTIIDDNAINNTWLLYGAVKEEGMKPYLISKIFNEEAQEITMEEGLKNYVIYNQKQHQIKFTKDLIYYLPRILSIVLYGRNIKNIKPDIKVPRIITTIKPNKKKKYEKMQFSTQIKLVSDLIRILDCNRAEVYHSWMEIGWTLYNISDGEEEGLILWKEFSSISDKYCEQRCNYEWDRMEKKNLTIGSLKYWASVDNPDKYSELINKNSEGYIKNIIGLGSHYDIAKTMHMLYEGNFICSSITSKVWYQFKDHHWEYIDAGVFLRDKISTEIIQLITDIKKNETEKKETAEDDIAKIMHDKRITRLEKLSENLKNSGYKDKIMREAMDIFYDPTFTKKLDNNPDIIPFLNGIYEIDKNIFREGRPDDFVSKTLPINYTEFDETSVEVCEVVDFFEKIFPDENLRKYFLHNLADVFQGDNRKKHVFMWTGIGDNGKSVTQKLIEKMLGNYAIKIPTTLLTSKKPNTGAAWPDLARAGNGVRWAVLEEPNENEKIQIGILKNLSGNDTFLARDLWERGRDTKEITPMFKLIFICNSLPNINSNDKATWNRIRVIPFEAIFTDEAPEDIEQQVKLKHFPKDDKFNQKIPNMLEPLAWYLLNYKKNNPGIVHEPDKVLSATKEYREDNDFMTTFTEDNFVRSKDSTITLDEMYPIYKNWYRENMTGTCTPKKKFRLEISRIWGSPENPGCYWKGWRQYTVIEQQQNGIIAVIDNTNPLK